MMKQTTFNVVMILSIAMFGVLAIATSVQGRETLDDLKFSNSKWSNHLLDLIDAGPAILLPADMPDVKKPPRNGGAKTSKELSYLHELAKTKRDAATIERIKFEDSGIPIHEVFLKEKLINRDDYNTLVVLELADKDLAYFILERKKHFARPRPSEVDPMLKTVVANPPHASYPSGHAAQTHMIALILSDFDPRNKKLYHGLADAVAHRREIAGIHYPSDTKAGRLLAEEILEKLLENRVFKKKYEAARFSYVKPEKENIVATP